MADSRFIVKNGVEAPRIVAGKFEYSTYTTTVNSSNPVVIDFTPDDTDDSARSPSSALDITINVEQGGAETRASYVFARGRSVLANSSTSAIGGEINAAPYVSVRTLTSSTNAYWSWTTRTVSVTIGPSITFGNNLWVSNSSTQIYTSTDTVTWTTRTSNFATVIEDVAAGTNLWAAVGQQGQIRTSTDAITWVTQTSNFGSTHILSVAFGNSLWVAGGYSGQIRTSTDAVTWVTQTSNFGSRRIEKIIYGGNTWVAAADNGIMRTSTDGTTWVTRESNTTLGVNGLAYGNNAYVATFGNNGAIMLRSTDAVTWGTVSVGLHDISLDGLIFADNKFVVVSGSGFVVESTDGLTWNNVDVDPTFNGRLSSKFAYGNGRWFSWRENVANSSSAYTSVLPTSDITIPLTVRSETRTTWTTVTIAGVSSSILPRNLAYGNGKFVAGFDFGRTSESTDGINWSTAVQNFGNSTVNAIAYGNSLWVGGSSGGLIKTSTDGITWVTRTSNFGTTGINTINYGNNLWTATGNTGQIRTSTDAITWATLTSPLTATLGDLKYYDSFWHLWQYSGSAAGRVSTDLVTWVTSSPFTTSGGDSGYLSFYNKVYISTTQVQRTTSNLGRHGMGFSTDGVTWSQMTIRAPFSARSWHLTHDGNRFILAVSCFLFYSSDGTTWSWENVPLEKIRGIAYHQINKALIIMGEYAGQPVILRGTNPGTALVAIVGNANLVSTTITVEKKAVRL